MKHVAVVGAGGYIGERLIPRLLKSGYAVTVLVPNAEIFADRSWFETVAICEVHLPATRNLRQALDGVQLAYYIPTPLVSEHEEVHAELENARAFAAHARGLEKIIVLSRVDTGGGVDRDNVSKAAVANILRAAAPVLEIATGPIIGAGSAPYELLRDSVNRLPFLATGPWGKSPVSIIGIDDLLTVLVRGAAGNAVGIYRCGCAPVELQEVLSRFAQLLGRTRQMLSLPWFPVPMAARITSWVTPLSYRDVRAMLVNAAAGSVEPDTKSLALLEGPPQSIDTVLLNAIEEDTRRLLATLMPDDHEIPDASRVEDRNGAFRRRWMKSSAAKSHEIFAGLVSLADSVPWSRESLLTRLNAKSEGRARPRRSSKLRLGDSLRYWRVVELEPNRKLALKSEQNLPGEAYVVFDLWEKDGRTEIAQTSIFKLWGLGGWLYWWLTYPLNRTVLIDFVDQFIGHAEQRTSRTDRRSRA